jgi:hypothetical protein
MTKLIHLSFAAACVCLLASSAARAGTITLGGTITQDTQDVGSPAVANPSLNNIMDGDNFTVILNFAGGIASPGNFSTTSLVFSDAAAAATESSFISGQISVFSASTIQFSVLGCLIDSASCLSGNQLALEFQISTSSLTSTGVSAQAIPSLLPMDLLEDGGSTDIQGTLTDYSYSGPISTVTPEPASFGLVGIGLTMAIGFSWKRFTRTPGITLRSRDAGASNDVK